MCLGSPYCGYDPDKAMRCIWILRIVGAVCYRSDSTMDLSTSRTRYLDSSYCACDPDKVMRGIWVFRVVGIIQMRRCEVFGCFALWVSCVAGQAVRCI